ncbi:inositol-tetrakisphosphate 1-kinase 1-like [Zingiber officinale]|uniref:Inositol-tetrakisphosphate 1-kinase n=1 Tax=Zingiber officinale TaxID=94328 RepID=A0A8J5I3X7_ZINOF|nr:inositol-tetrakisphosphate 1-kinase 1-like [Zingiber officinale]XP_042455144.1 inositol-tetrakisphosphate 1-kinase 1-like [Zingiber officinale]KAG6528096.1 hypothetical protein ZIOFF_010245 [Zingiber officinale]
MAEPSDRRFLVGYALSPKKQQSFIRPSLVRTARDRGVDLVPIDPWRPLAEQGPFDCVIHKLYSKDWRFQLADFAAKNPGVPIVDQPLADIERLRNRITMLQFVSGLNVPHGTETFGVPKQMLVNSWRSVCSSMRTYLEFPVIAKPLFSDASPKSHRMTLLFNRRAPMLGVQPPMVVQEFINHRGVLFKVYVAGNYVQCVRRKSLPDVPPRRHHPVESLSFSRQCNTPLYEHLEGAELPPQSFLEKIARGLRQATGLRLFNFDMIRDADARDHYFIIDINYFPGYSKMPGYEEFVTNFLWDMVHEKGESDAGSSSFSATD